MDAVRGSGERAEALDYVAEVMIWRKGAKHPWCRRPLRCRFGIHVAAFVKASINNPQRSIHRCGYCGYIWNAKADAVTPQEAR